MIEEKDVKHTAKLARINLTDQEFKSFQKELNSILDYFKKLDEVKVPARAFKDNIEDLKNVDREDVVFQDNPEKLKKLIPNTQKGFIKVKSIL